MSEVEAVALLAPRGSLLINIVLCLETNATLQMKQLKVFAYFIIIILFVC